MEEEPLNLNKNQQGFASIVIALVLILVLSLLTVGFAQLMNREQNSALSKQLSSQAYYAAESGINDAASLVNQDGGSNVPAQNTCNGSSYPTPTQVGVGSTTNAHYTCLIVDPTPPSVSVSPLSTTGTKIFEVEGIDPANTTNAENVASIKISWQGNQSDCSTGTSCWAPSADCTSLPSVASWGQATGMIRFELIPLNKFGSPSNNSGIDRADLTNDTYTGFFCPSQSSTNNPIAFSPNVTGLNSGQIVDGNCNASNTPEYCNVTINIPTSGPNAINESTFFITLRSIYSPTNVQVSLYNAQNQQLDVGNAQVLVDSTGKAQDVLRRIQVRIPIYNGYDIPPDSGATQAICKQLQVLPGTGTTSGC